MDESQEREATSLAERLQHELEILTAYQSKSKMAGESQRGRERQELEERVNVRQTLLEQKMDEETQQFLQERSERIRLLHERQAREIEQFDDDPRSDDEGEGKHMKQAVKSKGLKLS